MLLLGGLLASGSAAESAEAQEPATRPARATVLRIVLAVAALALLLSGSAFYLSARYVNVALSNSGAPAKAFAAAGKAEWLNPFSPAPAQARADAYRTAARRAADSGAPDADWAALDDLALAVHALEQAEEREPVDWTHPYQTGLALLDYREAAGAAGASAGEGGGHRPCTGRGARVAGVFGGATGDSGRPARAFPRGNRRSGRRAPPKGQASQPAPDRHRLGARPDRDAGGLTDPPVRPHTGLRDRSADRTYNTGRSPCDSGPK